MSQINILYIDDQPEAALSVYLAKDFQVANDIIQYREITFDISKGYEDLLNNQPDVRSADIIVIDSTLFEDRKVTAGKFTGEEFKLILRKLLPFKEVIIITQKGIEGDITKIPKYDANNEQTYKEYYDNKLKPTLEAAIDNIRQYNILAERIAENNTWEAVLKDKVLETLNGTSSYDELTKDDIDKLISAFREIQEQIL